MTLSNRLAALALLLPLLAACASKKPTQDHIQWENMRELFPPGMSATAPPADAPAGAAAASAASEGESAAGGPGEVSIKPPAELSQPAGGDSTAEESTTALHTPGGGDLAAEFAQAAAAPRVSRPTPEWPRTIADKGVTFTVHEPQVDAWDGEAVLAHALVIAKPEGAKQSATGAVRMAAHTEVDQAAGLVSLENVRLTAARFPGVPDKTQAAWLELLRAAAPAQVDGLSLQRVQSGVVEVRARERGAAVVKVPIPQVIIAKKPAVLVYIDGDPHTVPVKGTNLSGVINTNTLLLRDAAGKYYLHLYDGWVSAATLQGPWSVAKSPPGAPRAEQAARASKTANLLPGKVNPKTGRGPTLAGTPLPQIIVATKPTAVVVLDGEPQFAPIPDTPLQYATNTSAHLFRDVQAKQLYVRVEGYWFRAGSTAGPWEFVPAASLPAGFTAISEDSPKRNVKTAIIAAQEHNVAPPADTAPVMVAADPSRATLRLTIDGDPKLKPIEGTELNYVANASAPVIQLSIDQWYACQNGVWFTAKDATGPWTVTSSVPPEIYAIPPTSPIYSEIQSRVYSSSTDLVYYGYNPRMESFASSGGAIGVEDQGADYQYTPPSGLTWAWYY